MTLREMAEKAVWEHRPQLAGRVADRLRGKGFDSLATYEQVREWTRISLASWNELLRCADEGYD